MRILSVVRLHSSFRRCAAHPASGDAFAMSSCNPDIGVMSVGTGTMIRSTISLQDLIDFFGHQLADSGWRASTPSVVTPVRS